MGQNLFVSNPQQLAFEKTGYLSANYSAAQAGAQVATGPGVFKSLSVNTVGSGSTITLYDGTSTSGKKLGTWSGAALLNNLYNLAFVTGLFIVTTATAPDVTVGYSQ